MKHLSLILGLLIFSISLSGCATVNRGITDHFRIDTVPQGAKATTSIETSQSEIARRKNPKLKPVYHSCEPTPCAIPLYRRSEFIITLEHEDYETAEMFITNSSSSGSFTANMAATTVTTTGTLTAGAAMGAAVTATSTAISTTIIGGVAGGSVSLATFGLVPLETAVATGASFASSSVPGATAAASNAASAAIPPALLVTGGMLITDAVTGANANLYPNPVVLKLAPEGTAVKTDPNVAIFRRETRLESDAEKYCEILPAKKRKAYAEKCKTAKTELSAFRAEKKAAKKAALEKYRAAQKAAKEKAKSDPKQR